MRFDRRVLFITGGASGIGAETARQFAAEGGHVAIADISTALGTEVAESLGGALFLECDVSKERSVQDAVSAAHKHFGRLDCVVNAAGHVVFGPLETFPLDEWDRILSVHVTGTFLVCRSAVPFLRQAGGGSIVNVASIAALIGRRNLVAYSAAKGAIIALSRQLAAELAEAKIRVNVVAPGPIRTRMTEAVYRERGAGDFNRGAAEVIDEIPLRRIGEAADVASSISFLLSDESSFCTGSIITPDGGMAAI